MKILVLMSFFLATFLYSKTLILEISYVGDKFEILNEKIIDKDYPSTKASFKSKDNLIVMIKDSKNNILEKISISNPKVLTVPLAQENTNKAIKKIIKNSGSFLLRFKFNKDAKKIEINSDKLNQTLYLGGVK